MIFYKPPDAWVADVIPYFWDGRFYLYYLHERRRHETDEGISWHLITTTDFVSFTEHGEVLPRGGVDDQDLWVFTGCVLEDAGLFHIFYTGHNPHLREAGKPQQAVMHAVSDDLLAWNKMPDDTFFAPSEGYEPHDWRDPYVIRHAATDEWWMLLAARTSTGPERRRGCVALGTSDDLSSWQVREPLYAPGLYSVHECPDLFQVGDWWYLVFSEFSDRGVTRYRMAHAAGGPWLTPEDDTFDGHAFYAAKTASDGQKRYLFGWNRSRRGSGDEGNWQWGGNLVIHEISHRPDGTLSVRMPDQLAEVLERAPSIPHEVFAGHGEVGDRSVLLKGRGSFAGAWGGHMPDEGWIRVQVFAEPNSRFFGVILRGGDDGDSGYFIKIDVRGRRIVFDRWPRHTLTRNVNFAAELERSLELESGKPVIIDVVVEGSVGVAYINDSVAMSFRAYDLSGDRWGVFVEDGEALFSDA